MYEYYCSKQNQNVINFQGWFCSLQRLLYNLKPSINSVENQAQDRATCEHTFWESMITQKSSVKPLLSTH